MPRHGVTIALVITSGALVGCFQPAAPAPGPRSTPAGSPSPRSEPLPAPARDVEVERPIVILEEEVVLSTVPQGMNVADAYGVGGGAAGAYGQRFGKGRLIAHGGGVAQADAPALPPPQPLPPLEGVRERADDPLDPGAANPDPVETALPAGFTATRGEGLASTFAIDVDTASYALVRQRLLGGALPDPGQVRVEELLNAFSYEDPPPAAEDACPVAVRAELAVCPWEVERRLLRVALKARTPAQRPPTNLVFLLDVSGSMRAPGRLPLVKRALRLLVEQLGENDRVALAVYAGASGLVLPSTCCDDPRPVLAALDRLEAGGSTNGGAGLELAYRTALDNLVPGGVNRVILCTDGDWNVGATSPEALEELIAAKARSGVFLSVLGFGMGTSGGDATMERLADRGNGHYAYVDSEREARKVLVRELLGTLVTVAKDVKVQLSWDPARVAGWRLIGYENRRLENREFRADQRDAGEVGAGHGVSALYELVLRPSRDPLPGGPAVAIDPDPRLGTLRWRWKEPAGERARERELLLGARERQFLRASTDLRFAAAVAAFGLTLRGDPPGDAGLDAVRVWADTARGADPHGARAELVGLIDRARELGGQSQEDPHLEARARAADRALAWLNTQQGEDGSWRAGEAGAGDVGPSALALLAYLNGGHTHRFGSYKRVVHRGLRWLRAQQVEEPEGAGDDGRIGLDTASHAPALLALCEAYAMSRDFTLRKPAQRALRWSLAHQDPDGSWGGPGAVDRTAHTTAWTLLALHAARVAGLELEPAAGQRAVTWLGGPATSACAADLARLARVQQGDRALRAELRGAGLPATAFDGACALFARARTAEALGGEAWPAQAAALTALAGTQASDGSFACAAGCLPKGRVGGTALTAIALQVSCRPRCFKGE